MLSEVEKSAIEEWQIGFENKFKNALTSTEIEEYIEKYSAFNHPVAYELISWLKGNFAFDLNCLT